VLLDSLLCSLGVARESKAPVAQPVSDDPAACELSWAWEIDGFDAGRAAAQQTTKLVLGRSSSCFCGRHLLPFRAAGTYRVAA